MFVSRCILKKKSTVQNTVTALSTCLVRQVLGYLCHLHRHSHTLSTPLCHHVILHCCVTHPPTTLSSHIHIHPHLPAQPEVGIGLVDFLYFGSLRSNSAVVANQPTLRSTVTNHFPHFPHLSWARGCVSNPTRYHPHRTLLHCPIGNLKPHRVTI